MRTIDADALRSKARQAMLEIADTPLPNDYASKLAVKMGDMFQKLIDEAPTIDAEPARHGRWLGTICSQCLSDLSNWADAAYEEIDSGSLQYCPHCGAKMDAEVKD